MPGERDSIEIPVAGHRLSESATPLEYPADAGHVLLPLARAAIAAELGLALPQGTPVQESERHSWLLHPGACFITLMRENRLRGCIGTLRPHRPLAEDVAANALGAAFRDPRFPRLTAPEFSGVSVEISVLSALEAIRFSDEGDALRQLRAGLDGIVFEYGHHASTFLPQVWTDLREPADFLAHLKYKAGLPPDFWDKDVRLSRYTVFKWREEA
jgi:AmmeMemoRadiSam system protein A